MSVASYGQRNRDVGVNLYSDPFQLPSSARANLPGHATGEVRRVFEQRLRAAYVRAMRRWVNESNAGAVSAWGSKPIPKYDGGLASNGRRYVSAWAALATFLAEHNCLDPEGFIAANCIPGCASAESAAHGNGGGV